MNRANPYRGANRTGIVLLFLLLFLPLGAAEKVPLRVMDLPYQGSMLAEDRVSMALLREFKRLNPEIELSPFSGISIQNMGAESRLMLAMAGGSAPDVLKINFRMSDTYIQQNFLYPLDRYIEKDPEYRSIQGFLKTIPEAIQPLLLRKGPAIGPFRKGVHVWMTGGQPVVRALHWRKDVFQEAGLDPERPPKTWDELLDFARRLSDPAENRFGFSLSGGPQSAWDFLPFLWGAGGEVMTQDKNGVWRASFGSREGAVALEFYLRLAMERWQDSDGTTQFGYTTITGDAQAVRQAMSAGKLAMYNSYLRDSTMGTVDPALVGIAPFPMGPAGIRATEINAGLMGIFAGITGRTNADGHFVSAEKIRDAAWKFIRFMNSRRAREIYTRTMIELGLGRNLSPMNLREFGYTEYLKYYPPDLEKVYNYALRHGKPEPYGRNCQMVYVYLTKPLDEAKQMVRTGLLPEGDTPEIREERIRILHRLLKTAEERTNARMVGHVPEAQRQVRTAVTVIAAILIFAVFCLVICNIWKTFSPRDSYSGRKKGFDFRRNWPGYLIMLPALISIALWVYYPMVSGSQLLFQDHRLVGESNWNGLDNLAGVLFSPEWWGAVWTTVRYMALMLSLGFLAPIILAILLQEVSHGKIIYRTLYYLPAVMSGVVVMFMWKLFYQQGSNGILNQIAGSVAGLFGGSFTPVAWLEDARWALLSCVIPVIWSSAGPGCLIYLAALKGVPEENYEAAEIDGANFFQKILHVTLPSLKPLIVINFVGAFIAASQSGGMILVMTFGSAKTEVAELHIFKEAYTNLRFGSAIAMAWVLGVMTVLFTIYNLKRLSKMVFKTTGK